MSIDETKGDGEPSPASASSTTLACRCGLHKWVVIRSFSENGIRSDIRHMITGRYHGTTRAGRILVDRVCVRCEKRDDQISRAESRIEAEERRDYEVIARATANDPHPRIPPMPRRPPVSR